MSDPIEIRVAPGSVAELTTLITKMGELATVASNLGGTSKSLDQLTHMVKSLGNSAGGLEGIGRSLDAVLTTLQNLPNRIENAVTGMQRTLQESGRKGGQALGEGLESGAKQSIAKASSAVTQSLRELQAKYEAAVAKGWTIKPEFLSSLATAGGKLFPDDRERLKQWQDQNRTFSAMLKSSLADQEHEATAAVKRTQAVQNILRAAAAADKADIAEREALAAKRAQAVQNISRLVAEASAKETADRLAAEAKRVQALQNISRMAAEADQADIAKREAAALKWAQAIPRLQKLRDDAVKASSVAAASLAAKRGANSGVLDLTPSGAYSDLRTYAKVVPDPISSSVNPRALNAGTSSLLQQASALLRWKTDANDAHSAARGLASGFGLLWLTWGNMLPLLTGAAISNSLANVVKIGADVNHTLETIRVLSEESAASIVGLEGTLISLAQRGPIGPKEIAESLKTLSLAGLSVKETGMAINDVMNMAVAGTTSMKNAAETLTSVASAFDIPATSYSHIADLITKASAVSKASVESMSEAFKRASAVHKLYGVSLEDMAVQLTLVNNLGIQGTAAGTAVTNLYADLQGRTDKVAAAMKKYGVEVRDANGQMKDLVSWAVNVATALRKMEPASQGEFMRFITSERGARAFVPIIEGANKLYDRLEAAKQAGGAVGEVAMEAGKKVKDLLTVSQEVRDNLAYASMAKVEMSMTPLNQMKSVVSSLETSLSSVFQRVSQEVSVVSLTIREAFASEGFKSAVGEVAKTIASATVYIVEHADAVVNMAKAYIVWKTLAGGVAIFSSIAASASMAAINIARARDATLAQASAQAALNAAMTGGGIGGALASFSRFIPVVGTVVSLLSAGWMAWEMFGKKQKESTEITDKWVAKNGEEYLRLLKEQEDALRKQVEAKLLGISVDELQAKITAENIKLTSAQTIATKRAAYDEASRRVTELANMKSRGSFVSDARLAGALENMQQLHADWQKATLDAVAFDMAVAKSVTTVKELTKQLRVTDKPDPKGGSTVFNKDEFKKKPIDHTAAERFTQDLLKVEDESFRLRMETLKRNQADELKIIEATYAAKLIDVGKYESEVTKLTVQSETDRINLVNEHAKTSLDRINAAREGIKDAAGPGLAKALTLTGDAFGKLAGNMRVYVQDYKHLNTLETAVIENQRLAIEEIHREISARERLAAVRLQGKIAADLKEVQDLGRELAGLNDKLEAKYDLEVKRAAMSPRQQAVEAAQLEATGKYAEALDKLEKQSTLADATVRSLEDSFLAVAAAGAAIGDFARFDRLLDQLNDAKSGAEQLKAAIAAVRTELEKSKDKAGSLAGAAFDSKEQLKLRDNIADAIVSGIMKGRDGAKSIWVTFRDWLKNTFANTVLKPVFQTVVGNVMGSVGSSLFGSAAGSAAGSALGGATGSLVGPGTAMGSALGSIGFDSAAYMAGAEAGVVGGTSGAFGWMASGEIGTGLSQMAGALGPYAIAIAALAVALNKKATPHVGGYAFSDASGTTDITAAQGGKQQAETQTAMAALSKGLAGSLNSVAETFGKEAGYGIKAVFESDNNDASWGIFNVMKGGQQVTGSLPTMTNLNKDPTKGMAEYGIEAAKGAREALLAMDIPAWAKKVLNDLGDSIDVDKLNAAVDSIKETEKAIVSFKESLVPMGGVFTILSGLSSDAVAGLSKAAGGLDNLSTSVADYYQNYYTETERNTQSLSYLTAEFNKLGLGAMPSTKEGLRQVIDGFIQTGEVSTEAGQQTLASLLMIASGYAKITDSSESVSKARELEIELLIAQGNGIEALKLERAGELAALKKVNPALAVTKQLIWDIQDATKLANKTRDLEVERLNTLGLTVQATNLQRENELKILAQEFPALVDNQKALWNLQDTRKVEQQLIEAQGKSAVAELELRKANLAALDATNPALADLTRTLYAFQASATNTTNKIPLWQGSRDTGLTASSAEFYSELKGISADELQFAANEYMRSRWGDTPDPSDPSKLMRDTAIPAFQLGALQNSMAINRLIQQKNQNPNADKAYNDMLARGGSESPAGQLNKTLQDSNNAWKDLYDALKDLDKTMTEYIDNLDFNDLSNLSPEAQYAKAKADYAITKAQAMAGDGKAMENMEKVMQRLLETSQAYNASGAGYGTDMAEVKATWAEMSKKLGELITHAAAQVAATSSGLSETNDLLSSGNTLADKMARTQGLESQRDK